MGQAQKEIGEYAEKSFEECLKLWFGGDSLEQKPIISKDDPDVHGVDRKCEIKSYVNPLNDLKLFFQIKSKYQKHFITNSYIYGKEHCISINFKQNQVRKLYNCPETTFIVVGIPSVSIQDSINEFINLPSHKRFKWYGINAKLFIRQFWNKSQNSKTTEFPTRIHIPLRNELNTVTATLMWASWWTYNKTKIYYQESIINNSSFFSAFLQPLIINRNTNTLTKTQLNKARIEYRSGIKDIPSDLIFPLSHLSGAAYSMATIINQAIPKGQLDNYSVSVTESGKEEIAYWLFCKWYRQYNIHWSSGVVRQFERIFPLDEFQIEMMPNHIKIAHSLVLDSHKFMGIGSYIEVIKKTSDIDLTLVDKIGVIKTHLLNQNEMWEIEIIDTKGTANSIRDSFYERKQNMNEENQRYYMGLLKGQIYEEMKNLKHLPPPIDFFPNESSTIEYPVELWNSNMHNKRS